MENNNKEQMDNNEKDKTNNCTTFVQGDQNIFRDNSRLVKIVIQGMPQQTPQEADDYANADFYANANVAEAIAIDVDAEAADSEVSDEEMPKEFQEAPKRLFRQVNKFTRQCVKEAMDCCYTGQPTQLAYVMVTCFAYGLTTNINSYKDFVRVLMYWKLLPFKEADVTQMANTMSAKIRKLKSPDFRKWDDSLFADRSICESIGKILESKHCHYRY